MKTGDIEIGRDEFSTKRGAYHLDMWIELELFDVIKKEAKFLGMTHREYLKKYIRNIASSGRTRIPLKKKLFQLSERNMEFICKELNLGPLSKERLEMINTFYHFTCDVITYLGLDYLDLKDSQQDTPKEFEKVFVENEKDLLA